MLGNDQRTHSPPNAMDGNAMFSAPFHSPAKFLTESSVARLFQQKYGNRLTRFDPETEDDPPGGFIVGGLSIMDGEHRIPVIRSMEAPDAFILAKIRQLIDEELIPTIEDEFTAARVASFAFVQGVFNFLMIDPALGSQRHHRRPGEFKYREADECMEGRLPDADQFEERRRA